MSWRGYMVGTYGCATADAAANYRMQNPGSIGLSDRAAAARMNGSGCPGSGTSQRRGPKPDEATARILQDAAQTGQGITQKELYGAVRHSVQRTRTAQRDSAAFPLDAGSRLAIRQAVDSDAFARASTQQLALQLAEGKMTPAELGARLGRRM